MSKLAITYYQDVMRGIFSHVEIHKSGKEAVEYFESYAGNFFSLPPIMKKKPTISKDKGFSCRIGLRGYHVRFLNDDEVELYKEYGEKVYVNHKTAELVSPPTKEEKQ